MFNFEENYILQIIIDNNGSISFEQVVEKYKNENYLNISDWSTHSSGDYNWLHRIRESHHSLKDKGLIIGNEFGIWNITQEGRKAVALKSKYNALLGHLKREDLASFETSIISFEIDNNVYQQLQNLKIPSSGYFYNLEFTVFIATRIEHLTLTPNSVTLHISTWEKSESIEGMLTSWGIDEEGGLKVITTDRPVLSPSTISPVIDIAPPLTIPTQIQRIVRDTELSRKIKALYNCTCQICGIQIEIGNQRFYAEAHHLRPLGGGHMGPDVESNLIVLCPNHHIQFDENTMAINPKSMLIEHINLNNPYNGKKLTISLHKIDSQYLEYHYKLFADGKI